MRPTARYDLDLDQMRPVFVTGQYRSGTTLMNAILGNHTNLALPPFDRDWWTTFFPRYRRVKAPARWRAFLDELFGHYKVRILEIDEKDTRREADQMVVGDFAGVFALLLSRYAAAQSKPRWGEKTPFAHRYAERILGAYPQAQVIHMLRDPRDVFASKYYARYNTGLHNWLEASPGWVINDWLESVRLGKRFAVRYPDRYRLVRYEDLVAAPERIVRDVCAFLGESYQPGMLEIAGYPFKGGGETNSSFEEMNGISSASIGRHRQVLSTGQIWLCEQLPRSTLTRAGYDPSHAEPETRLRWTVREVLSLIGGGLPKTLVHIAAWHTIRIVRAILPRWTERRPRKAPGMGTARQREKILSVNATSPPESHQDDISHKAQVADKNRSLL